MVTYNTGRGSRTSNGNGNGGSKWIRRDLRLALYLRDGFTCAYCFGDLSLAPQEDVTLEHLAPRPAPGTGRADNRPSNLVVACRSCNSSRLREDSPIEHAAKVHATTEGTDWAAVAVAAGIDQRTGADHRLERLLAKRILAGDVSRDAALELIS